MVDISHPGYGKFYHSKRSKLGIKGVLCLGSASHALDQLQIDGIKSQNFMGLRVGFPLLVVLTGEKIVVFQANSLLVFTTDLVHVDNGTGPYYF